MGAVRRAQVAGFWHRHCVLPLGTTATIDATMAARPTLASCIGGQRDPAATGRRRFVAAASLLTLAPGLGWSQPLNRLKRIGILGNVRPPAQSNDPVSAVIGALRDLGWSEGSTLAIEYPLGRSALRAVRGVGPRAGRRQRRPDRRERRRDLRTRRQEGDADDPDPRVVGRRPGAAPASSRAWRGRAETSPACWHRCRNGASSSSSRATQCPARRGSP